MQTVSTIPDDISLLFSRTTSRADRQCRVRMCKRQHLANSRHKLHFKFSLNDYFCSSAEIIGGLIIELSL